MALCPTLFQLQLFPVHHHIPFPDLPFRGIDYKCQLHHCAWRTWSLEAISLVAHQ
jgi:hypothetical protein